MMTGVIDTNVLLRYLLFDDVALGKKAKLLMEKQNEQYYLSELILGEVEWVLKSFYKATRQQIADSFRIIINHPVIECNKNLFDLTLDYYEVSNLDFADCYLKAMSKQNHLRIISFDRKLAK